MQIMPVQRSLCIMLSTLLLSILIVVLSLSFIELAPVSLTTDISEQRSIPTLLLRLLVVLLVILIWPFVIAYHLINSHPSH